METKPIFDLFRAFRLGPLPLHNVQLDPRSPALFQTHKAGASIRRYHQIPGLIQNYSKLIAFIVIVLLGYVGPAPRSVVPNIANQRYLLAVTESLYVT